MGTGPRKAKRRDEIRAPLWQTDLLSKDDVRAMYDRLAPELDYWRARNAYYHSLVQRQLRSCVPEGARVLDLGCAQGDLLAQLRPSYGVGVDISPEMVKAARRKHPGLVFYESDIEGLDIEEGPFEYIVLSNTVGVLQDVQKTFRSVMRYCGPDTRIVVVYFNYLWEPVLKLAERLGLKQGEPRLNWLSMDDLQNLLGLEGFQVVKKRQSVLMPLRVPVLSGLLNRFVSNLPGIRRLGLIESMVARPAPRPDRVRQGLSSCTVIVPARNEKGNVLELVRRVPPMGSHTEIIFVEGHSEDGTPQEIERVIKENPGLDIKLLRQDGVGKADAVRKGFQHAAGDVIIILDADLTVSPEELPKFFDAVVSGKGELVIGSRLVYQLQHQAMRTLNLLGNKFFSKAFSYLLDQRIKDTLCGTKAVRKEHYELIRRGSARLGAFDPFGDFELIFGASVANLRILEVPVRYQARKYGRTQIKRFRHGLLLLRMVLVAIRKLKFV